MGSKVPPRRPNMNQRAPAMREVENECRRPVPGKALLPDMALPQHDELLTREPFESDRSAHVDLVGADAALRAETVFEAIGETRRGVHHHRARIHLAQETPRARVILGDDGVGVLRAVALDVGERRIEIGDHAHREDGREEFRAPIAVARGLGARHEVARARTAAELDAFFQIHLTEARVPVIKHLHGVCHVYIDDKADLDKAVAIAFNAKTQRYGTCNTMEALLVAEEIAAQVLPRLGQMYLEKGVELRGCPRTRDLVPGAKAASDSDWGTEFLAPILAVRVVADLDAALAHIERYGSQHTDAIVTEDYTRARRFLREVDSSSVMVNASTRFADGFEYGLGAESGISTDKIHVRGPVGLEGLTSQKFIVLGEGHVRKKRLARRRSSAIVLNLALRWCSLIHDRSPRRYLQTQPKRPSAA